MSANHDVGPAVSLPDWYQDFARYVAAQDLPLDFFSFHNYGEWAHDWISRASARTSRSRRSSGSAARPAVDR